jgi:hypothetical protein
VAQAIQLGIEYDPQPPFDAGSPRKAPRHIAEMVREMFEQLTRHDGRSDAAVSG